MSWGTLYGIGIGPGDPELLTLKAFRVLSHAAVIFHPACGGKEGGFALDILQRAFERPHMAGMDDSPSRGASIRERCRPLSITMVRGADAERPHWTSAAEIVAAVLQNGQDAAFITEGDPLLYSTFIHLQSALAERFPEARVEIIPGVSSITAAAARAAFPLAVADERIAVLPATYDPDALEHVLDTFDSVVLLKVSRVLDHVVTVLERRGLLKNAVFVERCGTPMERIITDIAPLRGQRVDYFSLLLVRKPSSQPLSPLGGGRREGDIRG
jgi:precorrin-2/cobalt-factor-2 C20-methyltransferase